jgi:hypothetical protein
MRPLRGRRIEPKRLMCSGRWQAATPSETAADRSLDGLSNIGAFTVTKAANGLPSCSGLYARG